MASVIRYGSARLFASDSSNPGTLRSFSLVQDVNFGFNVPVESIRSIGSDVVVKELASPPTVSIQFDYFLSDLENSKRLGIPVESQHSIDEKQSLLNNIQPIDIALVTDDETRNIDSFVQGASSEKMQELKVYVIKNAYLTGFSIKLSPRGIPVVSVSLEGEDILFKIFKNLSDYTSFVIKEDIEATNQLDLVFSETGIGGSKIVSTVDSFDFSMSVDYKKLVDFGQFYHKRKVDLPLLSTLSISATPNEFEEGALHDVFCQKNLNKFIIVYSRVGCDGVLKEKFGMVFKDALLVSQNYTFSTQAVLKTSLSFQIDMHKDKGVFFVQQASGGEGFDLEGGFGGIMLEDEAGTILLEGAITDMMLSLESV